MWTNAEDIILIIGYSEQLHQLENGYLNYNVSSVEFYAVVNNKADM